MLTQKDLERLYGKVKTNKYHNIKVSVDGYTFDSIAESRRYGQLKLLEKGKVISDLKRQVKFVLIDKSKYGREVSYIADFTYYEQGKLVVEDVKGIKTDIFKLKARLFAERYGFEIKIITKKNL